MVGPPSYGDFLDAITRANVKQFVEHSGITITDPTKQFELFVAYCVLSSVLEDALDLEAVATGSGNDCGVDTLAIVANGALVTEKDQVQDILDNNKYLDIQFFFLQSTISSEFSGQKINTFFFGIEDFFKEAPSLPMNDKMAAAHAIKEKLYRKAAHFTRGNPDIFCYYASTGTWGSPQHTVAIIEAFKSRLAGTNLLDRIKVEMVDARSAQQLYRSTQNGLRAEITITNILTLPPIEGVDQSHLGFIPAQEYLKQITDEHNNIRKTVFYDNVRDFQGDNKVNEKIAATLNSSSRVRTR